MHTNCIGKEVEKTYTVGYTRIWLLGHGLMSLGGSVHSWVLLMAVRRGLLVMTWRGWGISKGYRRAPATEKLLLASHAVLVGLKSCRPGLDQSILDRTHNIRWKHRPGIDRTGHRLLPRL